MSDEDIHERINALVEQEHQLRAQSAHTEEQRAELGRLEIALDQAWDLLRQRDARRDAGEDPSAATTRPESEVEGYLQ
jgi:hypothetical protein